MGPVDIAGDRPIVGYAMAARHSSTPLARRAGEMWGSRSRRQHARGVDFAVYDAIDIEIEPHSHEDRHLIFVMGGSLRLIFRPVMVEAMFLKSLSTPAPKTASSRSSAT